MFPDPSSAVAAQMFLGLFAAGFFALAWWLDREHDRHIVHGVSALWLIGPGLALQTAAQVLVDLLGGFQTNPIRGILDHHIQAALVLGVAALGAVLQLIGLIIGLPRSWPHQAGLRWFCMLCCSLCLLGLASLGGWMWFAPTLSLLI